MKYLLAALLTVIPCKNALAIDREWWRENVRSGTKNIIEIDYSDPEIKKLVDGLIKAMAEAKALRDSWESGKIDDDEFYFRASLMTGDNYSELK